MLLSRFELFPDAPDAERIRLRPLEEAAVPTYNVFAAILCGSVELCGL